ncbi:tyrosinase-like protein [Dreissena polymorpha]|nr:tyrosinase-like protein [Dreissena polymorpha]
MWKEGRVRWEDYNITKTDIDLVNDLLESMMTPTGVEHSRSKRQSVTPPTGRRIRREYRRLSDGERNAFHTVLQAMKTNGQYNTFANLHRGIVTTSAHRGPNFLGWHRVYLALFEEAIRRINRQVSLPYWDTTLDFDMVNPATTIVFSSAFFGNGDGRVTTGPFANWETPIGRLTRNIAGGSTLFTKANIRSILTRCRTREITVPTALPQFNFESFHNGPHVWVGGQMSGTNTAAHDPVFFLFHAFIDYVWELFRVHQLNDCRVDPSTDYPPVLGEHAPNRAMDGLPGYRNIDGYRSYWTQNWYSYESSPSCPNCNSPYLRCDTAHRVCVSSQRTLARDEPATVGGWFSYGAAANSIFSQARDDVAMLNIGPLFIGPPAEPRTQIGQERLRLSRMGVGK